MRTNTLIMLALCLSVQAQDDFKVWKPNWDSRSNKWFEASQLAMAGTRAADFSTSYRLNGRPGLCETNEFYRRQDCQFNVERGVIFKLGGSLAGAVAERYVVRRWPRARWVVTVLNFAAAGSTVPAIFGNRKLRKQ